MENRVSVANTRLNREVADWIYDRIDAGSREEVGSMDSQTFVNDDCQEIEITIVKADIVDEVAWYDVFQEGQRSVIVSFTENADILDIEKELNKVDIGYLW